MMGRGRSFIPDSANWPGSHHGGRPGRHRVSFHRRVRRMRTHRSEDATWRRSLAVTLSVLMLGSLVLVACQAIPTTARVLGQETRTTLRKIGIDFPQDGPLDAQLPQTVRILARDGSVLAEINDPSFGRRLAVPLSAISPSLIDATQAAEDRRFYSHPGV